MGESKIKQGYKKTPVGMIPEDWSVKIFGECFKHLRAYTFSRNQLNYVEKEDAVYNIHYGDIHSTFPKNLLDVKKDIDLIPIIISSELEAPELLKDGDLIMADASEDYKGIGQSIELINVGDRKIVSGTHTFPLRPVEKFAPKYAGYIFSNFNTHKEVKRIATGISVYGISKANLSKIKLPIPPLPEQKAIADCLSTWDKGIEKLSALIASKKEQKKGLMQGIFNGKLKVENGKLVKIEDKENWLKGWKEVLLKTISTVTKGKQLNRSELNEADKYPSYSGGITPSGYTDKYNCDANTIIISEGGNSCGYVNFIDVDFWLGGHCYSVENNAKKMNKNFLYNILKYNEPKIMRLRVGSGLPNVQKGDLEKFKLKVPSLKEQTEIAEVFNAANKEIELLEQKLESYKTQKKGLMQVLLTGALRLCSGTNGLVEN